MPREEDMIRRADGSGSSGEIYTKGSNITK